MVTPISPISTGTGSFSEGKKDGNFARHDVAWYFIKLVFFSRLLSAEKRWKCVSEGLFMADSFKRNVGDC